MGSQRDHDVLRVFGDGGAKGARAAPQLAQGFRCAVVGALALLVVVFAIGQTEDDSVRNLLTATKAYAAPHKIKLAKLTYDTHRSTQLAMHNRLSHMNPKQQMLYDEGMEDEAHKQMNIAEQTFMKGQDEGVLEEYDALNQTITEEQDALSDYAAEMGAIQLEVENEAKEHAAEYTPILPISKFKAPVGRQDFDGAQRRGLGQAPLHKTICLLI